MTSQNQTQIVTAEYALTEWAWTFVQAEMTRLNRRAAKLAAARVTVEVVSREDVEDDGAVFALYHVRLTGAAPAVAGYEFVATLSHVDGATLIQAVPGRVAEGELARYRDAAQTCVHCGAARTRRETFLVRAEADGALKQVGRNCLRDFLGGEDPHAILAALDYFAALTNALETGAGMTEPDGGWGEARDRRVATATLLTYAAATVRQQGWLSRTAAREQGRDNEATATVALNAFYDDRSCRASRATCRSHFHPTLGEADKALGAAALEWARGLREAREAEGRELSDYEYNLWAACSGAGVEPRHAGIVCSAVRAYQRALALIEERKVAAASSHHVGSVNERLTLTVNVLSVFETAGGAYGPTYICALADDEGNRFKWFASSPALDRGDRVTLKGTVKAHGEWKGVAETVITRCKVVTTH